MMQYHFWGVRLLRRSKRTNWELEMVTIVLTGHRMSHKKSHTKKKWSKVNQVHRVAFSNFEDDLMHDSGTESRNRIILTKVEVIVEDCKIVTMSFRELEDEVMEEAC